MGGWNCTSRQLVDHFNYHGWPVDPRSHRQRNEGGEMNIPEEWPTEEMIEAGRLMFSSGISCTPEFLRGVFVNMLAAAPTPPAQDEPVASLYVSHFRGHLENTQIEYLGELPDGTYKLYTRPQSDKLPAQEDEPVASINRVEMFGQVHIQADLNQKGALLPDDTPLYTRPQSDKLREAAAEVQVKLETLASTKRPP